MRAVVRVGGLSPSVHPSVKHEQTPAARETAKSRPTSPQQSTKQKARHSVASSSCTASRQRAQAQAQAGQGDMWKSVCATAEVVCATEAPSRVSRKRVCYRSLRSCVRACRRAACVRVRVLSLVPEQRHRRFLGWVTWCWAGCSVGWERLDWFWVVR
jgi:hypothetical protein